MAGRVTMPHGVHANKLMENNDWQSDIAHHNDDTIMEADEAEEVGDHDADADGRPPLQIQMLAMITRWLTMDNESNCKLTVRLEYLITRKSDMTWTWCQSTKNGCSRNGWGNGGIRLIGLALHDRQRRERGEGNTLTEAAYKFCSANNVNQRIDGS